MNERPTIADQLREKPQVADGIWDICAPYRGMGEVLSSGIYFYPTMRYPTTVSFNVTIKTVGWVRNFGDVFRRYQGDSEIVCLRFQIDQLAIDLFWDNNISIVPIGGVVL